MNPKETELLQQLTPVIEGLGVRIIDLSFAISKGTGHLVLIVYSPDGIGHHDLTQIHRIVQARMEILDPHGYDLSLEISTPGIERTIKNDWEYDIFINKGIKVLLEDESEWCYGILTHTTDDTILIENAQGSHTLKRNEIRKAKLDPQQDRR